MRREGVSVYLGCFSTAEEAALTLARRRRRAEERRPASVGVGEEDDERDECPVCLEPLSSVADVVTTKCGHDFCRACLIRLFDARQKWTLAEQKNIPSLIMKRARAADSSQAGPSSPPPKVYPFSAAEIGQDAGRLPRRPRACQAQGLPDWRPPPADPEQSA